MARETSIEALKRRGIEEKVARILVEIGYTLKSLKSATAKELEEHISKRDARTTLSKLGIAPEKKPSRKSPRETPKESGEPPGEGKSRRSGTRADAELGSARAEAVAKETGRAEAVVERGGVEPDFSPESSFKAIIGLQAFDIDDETVVVDLLSDRPFRLNPTATFIWQLVLRGLPIGRISEELAREYKVSSRTALETSTMFVKQLVAAGLAVPFDSDMTWTEEREERR